MNMGKSWCSLNRVMWALFALCGVVLIALAYRKQVNNPLGSDLGVYLHAARTMLAAENLYTIANDAGKFYRYPPLFAFICTPLANLPFNWAVLIWSIFSIALVCIVFLTWYHVVADRKFLDEPPATQLIVAGISLLVLLRYLLSHLYYGQANLLLLAVLVAGYLLVANHRLILGGVIMGCSLLLKPFAIPFLVWYAVSARLKVIAAAAIGVVAGAAIPMTLVGVNKNWLYLHSWVAHMMEQATPQGVWSASNNVSLYVSLRRVLTDMEVHHLGGTRGSVSLLSLPDSMVQIMAWMVFVVMLLWIVYVGYKYGRSSQAWMQPAVASFIFALIAATTTTAQKHYFVVILPALVYVLYTWTVRQYKDALFRGLLVASLVLLAGTSPMFWPRTWVQTFQSIGLIPLGAVLLAAAIHRSFGEWGRINRERGDEFGER